MTASRRGQILGPPSFSRLSDLSDISVSTLLLWVIVLLVVSGFFSIAETAMMAVNRHRLRLRAQRGVRGAKLALGLLARTDKLLGVILLGNTLVAAGAATLTAVITNSCSARARWRSRLERS